MTSVGIDEITDGEIEIIGPDIDTVEEGTAMPLAIWVEVAGRKMQTDFEPILERQVHHMVNGAEGIWHMGQRDIVWTRVSKTGFASGLRLRHYGEILHAKMLADYPAIVDKVKVVMITDPDEVETRLAVARKVYDERNRRLATMTDDNVDTFYSCLLCQSFAPDHVCIITPERLGLCGAYNWLDGKAAFEIDETGPNQPVIKGECLDEKRGIWEGINDYVQVNSHKSVESFCAYSIMDRPMTSCGCFEVICAYVPECNGVMVVNREFEGETPIGMTFSSLAGSVGGGAQTPGFIGVGKVFLTSRKFLASEGGFKRLVWMPKELKEMLKSDLTLRFNEAEAPDLFDLISDETNATTADEVRARMEEVKHPALEMDDMSDYVEQESTATAEVAVEEAEEVEVEVVETAAVATAADVEAIRAEITQEVRASVTKEVAESIINVLSQQFLGASIMPAAGVAAGAPVADIQEAPGKSAAQIISEIKSVAIRKEKAENEIWEVQLGNTKEQGGTRGITYKVGGATCMPFHLWEGKMPNKPLVAMEVYDVVSEKYPKLLRDVYGDLINNPAAMAKECVDKYGADLISVRLDGTHPERGNRTPQDAVATVKAVLEAVEVPLIITGHNSFDKNNEVFKAIAQSCEGENLLFNWVEQDNYRTIAGAAMAYGHTLVAQSPIDVNIGKQINILLTNMDFKKEKIIMDPMTGAIGYGIEYSYSVMERIRLTGLNGDKMLCAPMIVSPGMECIKIKEYKAPEEDFPMWGELNKRAITWEMTTAISLLQAGADIMIMYHPEAVKATKKTINDLLDGAGK